MGIMRIIQQIFKIISNILYFIIMAYAVIAFPILVGKKPLVVLSGSMEPTFKTGSVIYYEKVNPDTIKERDIITYKLDSGTLVTHRVIQITSEGFITKGDANNTADLKPIPKNKVLGKTMNYYVPYAGYIVRYISEHLVIVVIVIAILIVDFLLSNFEFTIKEEIKNKNKKKGVDN